MSKTPPDMYAYFADKWKVDRPAAKLCVIEIVYSASIDHERVAKKHGRSIEDVEGVLSYYHGRNGHHFDQPAENTGTLF